VHQTNARSAESMANSLEPHALARTVVLCFLAALCEGFDIQAAGIAAAGLRHELHPSPQVLGFFFSAIGAGLFLGALIGGRTSDVVGRKPVLVVSIVAFGICCLLTSMAPDMLSLIGARFLTGLGLGGAMPNLIAVATDASGPSHRSGSMAAAYVGLPLGGVVASLFVSALPLDSWRLVFQVGGIAPLVLVPLIIRYLPATRRDADGVPEAHLRATAMQVLFGEGRTTTTGLLWVAFFLIVLTLHLMLNWLPLLLMGRGLSGNYAVLSQAAFSVGSALTGLAVGTLLDSRWKRMAITVSVVALPAILLVTAICPPWAGLLIALAFLLGGSITSEQIIILAVIGARYDIASRGTATGAAVAVGRVGSLVGPLVAGMLLASGRSPAQVMIGILPIVLVGGTSVALLGWRNLAPSTAHGH
jgi:MFS transporter, AAHS family, 3-hydroxyphenylpropionic acid transporter